MTIINVMTSRLQLIFPTILNFWKTYNPNDLNVWMRLNTHRLRSDLVETFKIINGKYSIHSEIFLNLMIATEDDIAESCLKGVD